MLSMSNAKMLLLETLHFACGRGNCSAGPALVVLHAVTIRFVHDAAGR
jgi:hypothetical protein